MDTYGRECQVLVAGPKRSRIKELAYQIMLEEQEDGLRKYEIEAYEVMISH